MKKIKYLFLVLTVCAVAFSSCKKSSTKPATPAQSISLKFNGTAFSSSTPTAAYSKSQGAIQIIGQLNSTTVVYLAITGGVKVGTYNVTDGNIALTFSNGTAEANNFYSTAGALVITSFTATTISGTFAFTGTTTTNVNVSITEGTFTSNYTNQ